MLKKICEFLLYENIKTLNFSHRAEFGYVSKRTTCLQELRGSLSALHKSYSLFTKGQKGPGKSTKKNSQNCYQPQEFVNSILLEVHKVIFLLISKSWTISLIILKLNKSQSPCPKFGALHCTKNTKEIQLSEKNVLKLSKKYLNTTTTDCSQCWNIILWKFSWKP